MAVRLKAARPDDSITVQDPETGEIFEMPIISRDQMRELYLDMEAMQSVGGGVVTVYAERRRTGVPNEMVTVAAIFEWKDRADARPQPEDGGQPAPRRVAPAEPVAAPAPAADPALAAVAAEVAAQIHGEDQPAASPRVSVDDDDEDLSSIPAHLQEAV